MKKHAAAFVVMCLFICVLLASCSNTTETIEWTLSDSANKEIATITMDVPASWNVQDDSDNITIDNANGYLDKIVWDHQASDFKDGIIAADLFAADWLISQDDECEAEISYWTKIADDIVPVYRTSYSTADDKGYIAVLVSNQCIFAVVIGAEKDKCTSSVDDQMKQAIGTLTMQNAEAPVYGETNKVFSSDDEPASNDSSSSIGSEKKQPSGDNASSDTTSDSSGSSSAEASDSPDSSSSATKPTTSQSNALRKAKDYLEIASFSHDGLVELLEYEGFSHDDAVYGADNCGADWNEQAAKAADDYLEISAFSHNSPVEQLEYEGFTQEQAEYGVSTTGL